MMDATAFARDYIFRWEDGKQTDPAKTHSLAANDPGNWWTGVVNQGHATLAAQILHYVDIVSVIFGVALTSATTTPHLAPAPEPLPLPNAPVDQAGGAGNAA